MKQRIMYFELKTGYSDDGPAWIGRASFSKTGTTIYFNGKALRKGQGISSNYFDIENGDQYWISGIKKRGTNRYEFGKGKIQIDKNVIEEFLMITSQDSLNPLNFIVVELIQFIDKERFDQIANEKLYG